MRKVATTALVIAVWVGFADAAPKRKVRIDSSPAGAVVYIDTKENGPACEPTPCTIDLPIGETPIIVELPNYNTEYKTVVVPKRGKVKFDTVKLDAAVGNIVVNAPVGALLMIDGEDKGKLPQTVEVSADTHKVVITKDGKTLLDQYVEVTSGEDKEVAVGAFADGDVDGDVDVDVPDDDGGGGGTGSVTKRADAGKPRAPYVSLAAAMSVGFRSFTYQNNTSRDTLRDETESGQVLLGPVLELWPGAMLGVNALRGLSLLARGQFLLNSQPVTGGGIVGSLSTFWLAYEVSARHKWIFAGKYGVEVGGGWTREQYRFNGSLRDRELVPDAQYDSVRLGLRLSMLLPTDALGFEPYLDVENRFVLDGGPLQTRFGPSTSVSGFKGAAGMLVRRGGINVRAEAALVRYSWDFEATTMRMAEGGVDMITQIGLFVGYAY